jgi:hypothetical protein
MPVAAGQTYADTAWQQKGRTVVVEAVVGGEEEGTRYACLRVLTDADTPYTSRSTIGRHSRVRIGSNGGIRGYRLISAHEGSK